MATCHHKFWKDRNPPECLNCGKLGSELATTCLNDWRLNIPMGVSQWEQHGKKFGYWEYFLEKVAGAANK